MSKMSNLRLSPRKRLEILREEIPKATSKGEIAEICGVRPETISRDMRAWKLNGGFEEWLELEFFRLHNQIRDENAEVAYKVIARLLERTMVRRIEAEHKLKGPVQISVLFDARMEDKEDPGR